MLPELFLIEDSGVLISGYKGYVGTHLLARLKASSSPLNKILSCEEAASHQKKYKLIHLASKVENTVEAFASNLETDLKIFELAKKNNWQVVYASSNNVYPKILECNTENTPFQYDSFYAASKGAAELLLVKDFLGLESRVLRVADVFGPGQRHGNFFKNLEKALVQDLPFALVGSGKKLRSYIYIDDLVSLLLRVIEFRKSDPRIINAAYLDAFSLGDIINKLKELGAHQFELSAGNEDTSQRTMIPTILDGFSYNYTMTTSLRHYYESIIKQKVSESV